MISAVRPGSDELAALLAEIGALAAADSNVAHILRTHFQFVEERLVAVGDDRWMDDVLSGAIFGNATTELGNQDVGGRTFATTLDGLVLTGTKYYCTGSLYADFVPVLASTPEGDLVTVVVPADREGVTLEDDWDGIGQRLTGTGTVRLDGVRVEPGEVLGVRAVEAERAVRGPFLQLYLTAVMAGVVAAAARDAVDRARRRTRVFTHGSADTVAGDPLVQQVVGEMSSSAFAVEAIVLRARRRSEPPPRSTVDGVPDAALTEAASLNGGAGEGRRRGDRLPRDDAAVRDRRGVGDEARARPRPPLAQRADHRLAQPDDLQGTGDRRRRDQRRRPPAQLVLLEDVAPAEQHR